MFNSLRIRLTLFFVTLTIVPLMVVGALISSRAVDTLLNQSVKSQEQLAKQTTISLQAFFDQRQNELSVLTNVYGFDLLDARTQRDTLLALLTEQPAYYEVAYLDAAGQELIRITRGEVVTTSDLTSRETDPLFQTAITSRAVSFSPVHFNQDARDRLITMAVPIEDLYTGEIAHILIAEVRFQNIEETILRSLTLAEGEGVYIIDQNGVVIAHRNPSLVQKETVFKLPETNGRQPGLDNADAVIATDKVQLGNLNLFTVAETTYANATALAADLNRLSAIITGIVLVVAGLAVIAVVSRVVNPIGKLSLVAKAIQGGDFSQRANLTSKDEIGQFAAAFNAMTDAIQKRETDLREQADALRIATYRAKEAARVKGEFLANVSHELRTPLNAIIGFSDMLLAGMSGPLNDKQQHKLTRLQENGNRLLALINDLLDLTRIESGRLETVEKTFSPRNLAERITAQMESLATESKLKFETIISPDVPETVIGDEQRVEQVLVNLLSNAFKFTKEGAVTLNISTNQAERTWSLEVADTGIGIPPHAVNIIFEEFRQLDGSYSRAYKGSGLGLAITRNLVRMMSGKISVKSTLGSGSIFTVVLPVNLSETAETALLEPVTA
jgi:signal transduction histidine kinase